MALIKCKECGDEVSTKAKACPRCGAVQATKTKTSTWIVGAIFAAIIASCISTTQNSKAIQATKAPEPLSKEEIAAKNMKEVAFQKTVLFASVVKKSMREPDSVVWESIRSNDDASIVCIEYRGKNGFGGVSKGLAVYANGKSSSKPESWNKHCARPLNEMKSARFAVQ